MRVLVGCEFSGIVRDAFLEKGHDAWSCDLLPSERPGPHLEVDLLSVLDRDWDLMICHPPCTYLAVSGARWMNGRQREQDEAMEFVKALLGAPIPRICLENPVSVISTRIRKPEQVLQPWDFGHTERKRTCLWLKNLPVLMPTSRVIDLGSMCHSVPQSKNRWRVRSRTYTGVAKAMAEQWGDLPILTNCT